MHIKKNENGAIVLTLTPDEFGYTVCAIGRQAHAIRFFDKLKRFARKNGIDTDKDSGEYGLMSKGYDEDSVMGVLDEQKKPRLEQPFRFNVKGG